MHSQRNFFQDSSLQFWLITECVGQSRITGLSPIIWMSHCDSQPSLWTKVWQWLLSRMQSSTSFPIFVAHFAARHLLCARRLGWPLSGRLLRDDAIRLAHSLSPAPLKQCSKSSYFMVLRLFPLRTNVTCVVFAVRLVMTMLEHNLICTSRFSEHDAEDLMKLEEFYRCIW